MPQFSYQAVDGTGKDITGSLEAADRATALRQLSARGLQPFKVTEGAASASKQKSTSVAKPGSAGAKQVIPTGPITLSSGQVQLFTEELSELVEAGMRLEPALKLMEGKADETKAPYRQVAKRVGDLVREGHAFNSAIRMASPSFGELFCAVAAAGEAGGSLGASMKRQAQYQATSSEMRSQVAVALIYPGFLMFAGIGVTVLFITYLIPKLMTLIKTSRGKPPPLAAALIQVNIFLQQNWLILLILIAVAGTAFFLMINSKAGRPVWDRFKLRIPFVGGVLRSSLHSQFLETLASLSGGGLPLLKGLELANKVSTNVFARSQLDKTLDIVRDGGALSRAIEKTGLFPSNLVEMVRLGEHTGDLPAALRRAADRCARELSKSLEKAAAAIQPVIILLMAGIVGIMAYLMISIIYDTMNTLQNRKSVSYESHPALIQPHATHLA